MAIVIVNVNPVDPEPEITWNDLFLLTREVNHLILKTCEGIKSIYKFALGYKMYIVQLSMWKTDV